VLKFCGGIYYCIVQLPAVSVAEVTQSHTVIRENLCNQWKALFASSALL